MEDMAVIAKKLQINPGQAVAVVAAADVPHVTDGSVNPPVAPPVADAIIVFARSAADLDRLADPAVAAARLDKLTWVAYPKGGKLGTDLNRDILAGLLTARGLQPVRQVAIDETWSALRFRPA